MRINWSGLSCTIGTQLKVDGSASAYQWLRDGTAISGATSSSYTTSVSDVGRKISCQVSYPDGSSQTTTNAIGVGVSGYDYTEWARENAPDTSFGEEQVAVGTTIYIKRDPAVAVAIYSGNDLRASTGYYKITQQDVGKVVTVVFTFANGSKMTSQRRFVVGDVPRPLPVSGPFMSNSGTTVAPVITQQPSITPASSTVGDNVTFTLGTWQGADTVVGVLMQGGVNRTSEITDGVWSPGVAGLSLIHI